MPPVVTADLPSAAPSTVSMSESETTPTLLTLITHVSPPKPSAPYAAAHLTEAARSAAVQQAEHRELAMLRACLAEEQTALAVQRAVAEQSRRAADCARAVVQTLIAHVAQPCLVVNGDMEIVTWNAALAARTRLSAVEVEGTSLTARLLPRARKRIQRAIEDAFARSLPRCEPTCLPGPLALLPHLRVQRVTLLPLHRIPGSPEALLLLLEPEIRARPNATGTE